MNKKHTIIIMEKIERQNVERKNFSDEKKWNDQTFSKKELISVSNDFMEDLEEKINLYIKNRKNSTQDQQSDPAENCRAESVTPFFGHQYTNASQKMQTATLPKERLQTAIQQQPINEKTI